MVNYGIEPTFSNEESLLPPPPPPSYPYSDDDEEAPPEATPEEIINDLELNATEEFEHTLSQLDFEVEPYEEYGSVADSVADSKADSVADSKADSDAETTIQSEDEPIKMEKRNFLSKKRNLFGMLALILLVIVAALGGATRSMNRRANNNRGDLAVSAATESSAAIVNLTEDSEETSAATPAETPVEESTQAQVVDLVEDEMKESVEDEVKESVEDQTSESAVTPTTEVESDMAEDSDKPTCSAISELACSTEGLETLCALTVEACSTPGLESICSLIGELGGPGPYTIFAPNNSAFDSLPMRLKNAIQNPQILSNILQYHAIDGEILAADLACDTTIEMANSEDTMTLCNDGHFYQTGAGNFDAFPKIILTDVNACNGVIHVVDQVILRGVNSGRPPAWQNQNGFAVPAWTDGFTDGEILGTPEQSGGDEIENVPSDSDVGSCQDELSVSKDCYTFGESIDVNYKFCSPTSNSWFGVYNERSGPSFGRAAYWEMPCGGHNLTCASPMGSGIFTMSPHIPPGRYVVHGIGDINPPYISNSATSSFTIANECSESLPLDASMPLNEPVNPQETSAEPLPSHR